MAGGKTIFLQNELNDHVTRDEAYVAPTTMYLGYITDAVDADEDGNGTEFAGGTYARQAIEMDASSGGITQNTNIEDLPEASTNLGTSDSFYLFDALTAGNKLYHGLWTTGKAVNIGDIGRVKVGDISIDEG